MADVPTIPTGSVDGGGASGVPAYNYGLAKYASEHPDQWRLNNNVWEHNNEGTWTPMYKNDADMTPVGGNANSFGNYVDGLFSGRTDLMGRDTPAEAARKAQAARDAEAAAQSDNISARMQAFYDEMMADFDTNDPVYRGLIQAGTDAAQQSAGRGGLAGRSTLAGTQAASVAQQNVQPWMAARKAAGAQMLTQLSNRDISLGNLAQGQQQIDAGLAASKNAAEKNFWGTLGAVGGGVLGAYVGGPGGAQAGAQIGGGLASGLAGGSSGPAQPAQTWKPGGGYKPPSGSGY